MDGRTRLAQAFAAHVERMQWSQEHVASLGGPSTTTQSKIIHQRGPIAPQTCEKIDVVMQWPPGTAGQVLRGEIEPPKPELHAGRSGLAVDPDANEWFATNTAQEPNGSLVHRGGMGYHGAQLELSYRPGLGRRLSSLVELSTAMGEAMRHLNARTIEEGESDAGTAEAKKSPDDGREGGSNVTPNVNQDDVGLAARHTRSRGKQLRAEMDAAGEESQDMGEGSV